MSNQPKAIKLVDDIETRTARCPAMCVSEQGATRLVACVHAVESAMHATFDIIKEHLFEPLTAVAGDHTIKITVFDIYATGFPKECRGDDGKYTVSRVERVYRINSSVNEYPTRELFNPISPVLPGREILLHLICKIIFEETGISVDEVVTFLKESVWTKVDGMLKGYTRRVSTLAKTISGHSDSKWSDAVRLAAQKTELDFITSSKLSRVLISCGPQTIKAINGELPDMNKIFGKDGKKVFKTKVDGDEQTMSLAEFTGMYRQALEIYLSAYAEFRKLAIANIPDPKKVSLTVPSIKVDSKSTLDSTYFDWKVTVRGLPGGTVEMLLRAHSDKGTNYYPENIFALSKECPKGTLVFTRDVDVASMICRDANRPGNLPMTLNIPYEVPVKVPTLAKEDIQYVDLDKTLGIDAGVSVAGLITTIGPKEIGKDMLDWHEAVHAYHADHAGTNLFTKTATKATRDDLLRLVDEYNSGDYRLISMLTIGLRDGSPTDEAHGWKPVCDPCAPMFSWLKYRTNADGSRYYNDRQIAIIGHTKLWRKFIRQLIANRRHYFFEQARWDRVHDTMTEVFAQESPVAAELNKEYEILGDKIRVESTYLLSCELLTGSAMENYEIVSMEKLNLNDVKENIKFRSLYSTVANDWNMNPKNGYKVSASKNSNTATIDFGRPVTKEEVMAKCKETAHWQFPVDIKVNNTTATLYCEPTREGLRCRNSEWSDHYTNRAMHLALLKHDVARIVMRRGILYKEVPAKDTSKACHVCGYIKKESAADRKRNGGNPLDKEQCLAKKINYRRGREFICGNPACPMHGIIQNSDVNGSFNVRNLVKFSFKDFGKILPAK